MRGCFFTAVILAPRIAKGEASQMRVRGRESSKITRRPIRNRCHSDPAVAGEESNL